jgi:hypothetical protein
MRLLLKGKGVRLLENFQEYHSNIVFWPFHHDRLKWQYGAVAGNIRLKSVGCGSIWSILLWLYLPDEPADGYYRKNIQET